MKHQEFSWSKSDLCVSKLEVEIKSTQGERVYKTGSSKVREWFSDEFQQLRIREGISDEMFFQSLVGGDVFKEKMKNFFLPSLLR